MYNFIAIFCVYLRFLFYMLIVKKHPKRSTRPDPSSGRGRCCTRRLPQRRGELKGAAVLWDFSAVFLMAGNCGNISLQNNFIGS